MSSIDKWNNEMNEERETQLAFEHEEQFKALDAQLVELTKELSTLYENNAIPAAKSPGPQGEPSAGKAFEERVTELGGKYQVIFGLRRRLRITDRRYYADVSLIKALRRNDWDMEAAREDLKAGSSGLTKTRREEQEKRLEELSAALEEEELKEWMVQFMTEHVTTSEDYARRALERANYNLAVGILNAAYGRF